MKLVQARVTSFLSRMTSQARGRLVQARSRISVTEPFATRDDVLNLRAPSDEGALSDLLDNTWIGKGGDVTEFVSAAFGDLA